MRHFEEISEFPASQRLEELDRRGLSAPVHSKLVRMLKTLTHTVSLLDAPLTDRIRISENWYADEWVGKDIGGFRLDELLHQGAIAGVFLASQEEPVKRQVAIKLLRAEAPEEVANFFRFEQQALAKLSHPNIASIHTVDKTSDGLSYIVMEYIDGRELLDYCDTQTLSIRERLALFLKICDAISYSHQRGILHRDLKSSNILIRTFEGQSVPTIIDFGIASDLDPNIQFGKNQLMGTPEYMSPEHVLNRSDVDARSDVYSLGMVLFSLLVGRIPFERERIFKLDEAKRLSLIAEYEAPIPSQYFAELPETWQDDIANSRGQTRRIVSAELGTELDSIFLKATHKNRDQRYASVAELAADISNYRKHKTVAAHPSTVIYRTRKFVRRHAIASGAGLAIALLSTLFIFKILDQNRSIKEEVLRAERQRLNSEQVVSMIVETLSAAKPTGPSSDVRASLNGMLDKAYDRFQESGDLSVDTRAMLLINLAEAFRGVSDAMRAREVEAMIADEVENFGGQAQAKAYLLLSNSSRNDSRIHEAHEYAIKAHEVCEANNISGLQLVNTKVVLADTTKAMSQLEDANILLHDALMVYKDEALDDLALLASIQVSLADLARLTLSYDRAEEYFLLAKDTLRDHVGEDHVEYLRTEMFELQFLMVAKSPRVTSEGVEALAEKAVSIYGKESIADNTLQFFLANAYLTEGKNEQAVRAFQRNLLSLEKQDKRYGELFLLNLASLNPANLAAEKPGLALEFATEAFELVTLPNEVGHKYTPYITSAIELEYASALAANQAWEDALFHVNSASRFFEASQPNELSKSLTLRAYISAMLKNYDGALVDVDTSIAALEGSERVDEQALSLTKIMRLYVEALMREDQSAFDTLNSAFETYQSSARSQVLVFPHSQVRAFLQAGYQGS